jgi:hypothetical protein
MARFRPVIDRTACELLAQALAYYAPIDLTTFGT